MNTLLQDLQYGFRMLLKHPGVTAIAVLTLALGIGANTAIFSVVNAVLLNPLPYREPDRLVSLWENVPTHGRWRASPANFFDWKKQNTVFEDVVAFGGSSMTLTGDGEPEQLLGARVSSGYFAVVGVEPVLGRSFHRKSMNPAKGEVVILGHSLWQRRYGGDRNIINRNCHSRWRRLYSCRRDASRYLSGTAHNYRAHRLSMSSNRTSGCRCRSRPSGPPRDRRTCSVSFARLKPGISIEQAATEMNTIGARLEQEHAANRGEGIIVSPFMNEVVGDVRPALLTLLGAVGLVLLIACANVAGLVVGPTCRAQ